MFEKILEEGFQIIAAAKEENEANLMFIFGLEKTIKEKRVK